MEGRKERMEKERERVFENCFIDSPFYKTLAFFFPLFYNFPTCNKLHKHPPNKYDQKNLVGKQNLSPKSQRKNLNNRINLQGK
jgi:hypothetical protein